MNNENRAELVGRAFDAAVDSVKKLRGGVKAFVLVAFAAEDEEAGGTGTVLAKTGSGLELVELTAELCKDSIKDILK